MAQDPQTLLAFSRSSISNNSVHRISCVIQQPPRSIFHRPERLQFILDVFPNEEGAFSAVARSLTRSRGVCGIPSSVSVDLTNNEEERGKSHLVGKQNGDLELMVQC